MNPYICGPFSFCNPPIPKQKKSHLRLDITNSISSTDKNCDRVISTPSCLIRSFEFESCRLRCIVIFVRKGLDITNSIPCTDEDCGEMVGITSSLIRGLRFESSWIQSHLGYRVVFVTKCVTPPNVTLPSAIPDLIGFQCRY